MSDSCFFDKHPCVFVRVLFEVVVLFYGMLCCVHTASMFILDAAGSGR